MDSEILAAARDQMLLLIDEQKALLQALIGEPGLLHSRNEVGREGERVLSLERAKESIEVLEGDADKASRLEITLAVAGTVKAGKSTAVNAIIGTEALPNRNRPMTALPTVIRHETDRFEPGLSINNVAALNDLAKRISLKLQDKSRLEAVRKDHGVDMAALIDDLAESKSALFDDDYERRDRVFEALRRLNDLLRLGRHSEVGEALAIEEYDELHEMPTLTVHFSCLADTAQESGSLALLDLPGFNEARLSEHLKDVLREQLEKASAILVVLDYTQLNTVASEELNLLLDIVSEVMKDRVFVMVNKFDQRNSKDPDETATKRQASLELMNGAVDQEHVFPVSAKEACLAGSAQAALAFRGCMPSAEDEPWVNDFAQLSFGIDKAKIEDVEEVTRAHETLWNKSGFEPLLDRVIVAAQRRAGELALQSTLDKLKHFGGEIEEQLCLSANSLTANVEDLESTIRRMNDSIEGVERARGCFDARVESAMREIEIEMKGILKSSKDDVGVAIKEMFPIGQKKERAAPDRKTGKGPRRNLEKGLRDTLVERIRSILSREEKAKDWRNINDELRETGMLVYYDKDECISAWNRISKTYSEVAAQIVSDALSSIKGLMARTHTDLSHGLDDNLRGILEDARSALTDGDVEVMLQVPDFVLDKGSGKPSVSRLGKKIEMHLSEPYTVVTNRILNAIDPFDWFGWGKETVQDKEFPIVRSEVIKACEKGIADTLEDYRRHAENGITDWRRHAEDKFDAIGNYLDRYRQTLMDGMKDRSMEREAREQVLAVIEGMRKRSDDSRASLKDFETVRASAFSSR